MFRHHLITAGLLTRERRLIVFRETPGIVYLRETAGLSGPIHNFSVSGGEVVMVTVDEDLKPCRVFYLLHDRELDGISPFTSDQYLGVPARYDRIGLNTASEPPSFDFVADAATIERERQNHLAVVEHWRRADPNFGKVPEPTMMQRLARKFRLT